jgi:Bacterial PH domain
MSHDDFAFEPIRGLPAPLPEGEVLLWQGSPQWRSLALRDYHVRKVAVYFLALALYRVIFGICNGHGSSAILVSCVFILSLGGVAIGVLSLLAYLNGASTVYSITSRRVLLRHGIAVPLTMNIPFALIESAALKTYPDGTGEIALRLPPEERVGYLVTWPHLRPGYFTRPQPSLRALGDARRAAQILGSGLESDSDSNSVRVDVDTSSAARSAIGRQRTAAA